VNTASIAGLNPGSGPVYAASKHAVVALSEELFKTTNGWTFPSGSASCAPAGSALRSWTPTETGRSA
jgi:NADP-dependent 3-hydroxy acid dehydrogenase YdfG